MSAYSLVLRIPDKNHREAKLRRTPGVVLRTSFGISQIKNFSRHNFQIGVRGVARGTSEAVSAMEMAETSGCRAKPPQPGFHLGLSDAGGNIPHTDQAVLNGIFSDLNL